MPRYRFAGFHETVLHGLSHGVNAILHREERDEDGELVPHGQPDESTVVVRPGDEVETTEPYPHALMVNTATGEPDVAEAPAAEQESAESIDARPRCTGTTTSGAPCKRPALAGLDRCSTHAAQTPPGPAGDPASDTTEPQE